MTARVTKPSALSTHACVECTPLVNVNECVSDALLNAAMQNV